jgi:hypothetical protein
VAEFFNAGVSARIGGQIDLRRPLRFRDADQGLTVGEIDALRRLMRAVSK